MKRTSEESVQGISAKDVAIRAGLLDDPKLRSLAWWLQGQSLVPGALKRIAREIIDCYPERIGTPAMHRLGRKQGQIYNAQQVREIRREMSSPQNFPMRGEVWVYHRDEFFTLDSYPHLEKEDIEQSKSHPTSYPASAFVSAITHDYNDVENGIEAFCTNGSTNLWWYRDFIGALLEYKAEREKLLKSQFALTSVGRKVWEALDYALKTKRMVLLDGLEGRGKTEAARAWVQFHLGEARFVSLKGIANKTSAFREIARALGIETGYSLTPAQIQSRIEDMLQRFKLMLVIDEAHFCFNQSTRFHARPEMVDWIDTALANQGVPVGLVSTPQFINCMTVAADKAGWNYRQFRRRMKYFALPNKNSEADIERVARHVLPDATDSAIDEVVSYAIISKRDLSAIGDVVDELKVMLDCDTLAKVTHEQVRRAIDERLMPSDDAFIKAVESARGKAGKGKANSRRSSTPEPIFSAGAESDSSEENGGGQIRLPASRSGFESTRLPESLTTA